MSITCDPAYFQSDWPPPKRCAYCAEQRQEVVCRGHSGWLGEALCRACCAACLAECPVLPGAAWGRPEAFDDEY